LSIAEEEDDDEELDVEVAGVKALVGSLTKVLALSVIENSVLKNYKQEELEIQVPATLLWVPECIILELPSVACCNQLMIG